MNDRRLKEYNIKKKGYDLEQREFELNKSSKEKFVKHILKLNPDILVKNVGQERILYHSVHSHLTYTIFSNDLSSVLNSVLKPFIRVQSQCSLNRGKVHYGNIPVNKEQL